MVFVSDTYCGAVIVSSSVTVTVPGTTANIGPGFDCLGAALTIYNRFHFTLREGEPGAVSIQVSGLEAKRVATDASNLAYRSFVQLFQHLQRPVPAVTIHIDLGVPLARGLGSSSTAIVGGLVAANHLAGTPLTAQEVRDLAIALEGHPDNVVPALVGGCQLAVIGDSNYWQLCPIPWHENIVPVVAIPDFEVSTEMARQVLPGTYSRADAIFNTAHLGLLIRGLATENDSWLREAMSDRIHQPYRKSLIPGYDTVARAAIDAGAYGLVISGAGPTLLALTPSSAAESVRSAMAAAWVLDCSVDAKALSLDTAGVRLEPGA
jgi:homoserine kinase